MANNFFLTGPPRQGKSSLILEFIPLIQGPIGGFVVQRMLLREETIAFRLANLLEEPYRLTQPYRGKVKSLVIYREKNSPVWTPVLSTFNQWGVLSLKQSTHCSLIIMDELGIFEEEALRFKETVLEKLNSPQPVLGVIKDKKSPFLEQVRSISGLEIHRIENENTRSRMKKFLDERSLLKK